MTDSISMLKDTIALLDDDFQKLVVIAKDYESLLRQCSKLSAEAKELIKVKYPELVEDENADTYTVEGR